MLTFFGYVPVSVHVCSLAEAFSKALNVHLVKVNVSFSSPRGGLSKELLNFLLTGHELGFYFSSAQEFVTKTDLKNMAPYVPDRPLIFQHMERTTQALNKLNESLDK